MEKKLSLFISSLMLIFISACGSSSDEPENPNGLYDWDVTENIIIRDTGKFQSQNKYVVYDKAEDYMRQQKQAFDKKSNKEYRWQYIYQKRN